ncbi:MAG: molybdopterin-binding protein [Anaerolineaceae bacterium]|nr:molybdopterin-binding protein [Anaerolineaceae bacterium]
MPSAEIIAIGTELLLGEIQDTNTRQIARFLQSIGIDLFRTTIVGDNEKRITAVVQESIKRANIVITSGGLGPTVDDPTRLAIADALGVDLEYRPESWQQINQRFKRFGKTPTENNKKQAFIPKGAMVIENQVGTAPAFYCVTEKGLIISLPGVPMELEFLLENNVHEILSDFFREKSVFQSLTIHTSGAGESVIDEIIADLETQSNPTVGIVAYPGQVDIRITAKAIDNTQADKMISEISTILCKRLDGFVFGFNEDTLEKIVSNHLLDKNIRVFTIENGLENQVNNLLQKYNVLLSRPDLLNEFETDILELSLENLYKQINPNILLFSDLQPNFENNLTLKIIYIYLDQLVSKTFLFGGHSNLAADWAAKTTLNFLRVQLIKI